MKLDGSDLSSFSPDVTANNVSCVAIDSVSRYVYWGSQSASTIAVISLDGPTHYYRTILTSRNSTVASPVDLAVDPINGFVNLCPGADSRGWPRAARGGEGREKKGRREDPRVYL